MSCIFCFYVWGFCLGAADVIGTKCCSSGGAGDKTIAGIVGLDIASAQKHGWVKTKHEEGPEQEESARVFFFLFFVVELVSLIFYSRNVTVSTMI